MRNLVDGNFEIKWRPAPTAKESQRARAQRTTCGLLAIYFRSRKDGALRLTPVKVDGLSKVDRKVVLGQPFLSAADSGACEDQRLENGPKSAFPRGPILYHFESTLVRAAAEESNHWSLSAKSG